MYHVAECLNGCYFQINTYKGQIEIKINFIVSKTDLWNWTRESTIYYIANLKLFCL